MVSKLQAIELIRDSGIPVSQVVDVGVNYQTEELIFAYPEVNHVLFEIDSGYNAFIQANYKDIDYILYNIGLSDEDRVAHVVSYSIHGNGVASHSRISSSEEMSDGVNIIECKRVKISRLDSLDIELKPNYLAKIDIDGNDLAVLKGFGSMIQDCSVLIIEATFNKIEEVIREVSALGFGLASIVDIVYYGNSLYQCDIVFVRSDLINKILRPNISDFNKELWRPEHKLLSTFLCRDSVLLESKSSPKVSNHISDQPVNSKTQIPVDIRVGLITNKDWSLLVPLNEFYKDKELETFSLADFQNRHKGITHQEISSLFPHSKIWAGHTCYKSLKEAIQAFKPSVIIDIGGFAGIFSIVASSIAESAKIYTFEPIPSNLLIASINFSLNSTPFTLLPFAVGEDMRIVQMSCDDNMTISAKISNENSENSFIVPQVSIDSLLYRIKNERVCLKIDVEGLEPSVLKGLKQHYANNNIGILIIEYHPASWKSHSERDALAKIISHFPIKRFCSAWQFSNQSTLFSSLDELDQKLANNKLQYCDIILSKV